MMIKAIENTIGKITITMGPKKRKVTTKTKELQGQSTSTYSTEWKQAQPSKQGQECLK